MYTREVGLVCTSGLHLSSPRSCMQKLRASGIVYGITYGPMNTKEVCVSYHKRGVSLLESGASINTRARQISTPRSIIVLSSERRTRLPKYNRFLLSLVEWRDFYTRVQCGDCEATDESTFIDPCAPFSNHSILQSTSKRFRFLWFLFSRIDHPYI